jgi:hypothetical protein
VRGVDAFLVGALAAGLDAARDLCLRQAGPDLLDFSAAKGTQMPTLPGAGTMVLSTGQLRSTWMSRGDKSTSAIFLEITGTRRAFH